MWATRVRASANDRSVWGNFWFEPLGRLASSGVRVTPASALALPAVWACVRVLAESFAVLPFRLYQPKVGGGRNVITKHWLYSLFAKAPNRFQSPFEWREMLQGHLALRGNAYNQITANGAGEITELLPLHPDRMRIELLSSGDYRYVYSAQDGSTIYYTRGEIWHLRGLSSDGYMGMSPVEVEREAIGQGLSMQDYASRFFANDAKPGGGWIEYPGGFADMAAKKTFRETWQQLQGGANRGKVAVLERGMKFHELGLNNKDSQFIEARGANVGDIARIFRVQPHKIGDLTKATFSNIEQQSIEFWQDTMLPWCERWESSIGYQLLGPESELEVDFDMRRMMRGDAVARGNYYNTGILAGWLTRNEARDEEGLDPIAGLDAPLTPLNMQSQDDGIDTTEPGDAPTPAAPARPPAKADSGRFDALVRSNAARMARRIVAGSATSAELLAEALAVSQERASEWLGCLVTAESLDETTLTRSLVALAMEGST